MQAICYVEVFQASESKSRDVSLSLSEIHFPQICGKPEISDRFFPSCSPSFTTYLFLGELVGERLFI